ncbi:MAG: hypothetical protein AAF744_11135 [Pseudomonadota bacterium]
MKIKERSPERLRLYHLGWYYAAGSAVFGLLCLYAAISLYGEGNIRDAAIFFFCGCGMSLGLALVATRSVTVTLDRVAGIVHVRNVTATGKRVRSAPLSALAKAGIDSSRTGDLPMHRLTLHFNDRDPWIVTRMYTSGDGTEHACGIINDWLRDRAHFDAPAALKDAAP